MEEVRSVAEYIECLKGCQRSGLCGYRPDVRYYYRGESRDYGATSGQAMIGRGHEKWLEKHNEAKLFRECERRLTDEFLDCKSIFEKLVMMQHYGIPTRILDISLDPLVALFFALYLDPRGRKDDSGDGIVLVYEVPENSIKNYHSDAVSVVSNLAVYSHYDDLDVEKNLSGAWKRAGDVQQGRCRAALASRNQGGETSLFEFNCAGRFGVGFLRAPASHEPADQGATGRFFALWAERRPAPSGDARKQQAEGKNSDAESSDSALGEGKYPRGAAAARPDGGCDLPGLGRRERLLRPVLRENGRQFLQIRRMKMSNNAQTQNVQNQNMDNEELYRIECYVETVSSDGNVTVRGVDGYRLEKDGKTYNVFVEVSKDAKEEAFEGKIVLSKKELSFVVNSPISQWLKDVKMNNSKMMLEVKFTGDKITVQKVSLI